MKSISASRPTVEIPLRILLRVLLIAAETCSFIWPATAAMGCIMHLILAALHGNESRSRVYEHFLLCNQTDICGTPEVSLYAHKSTPIFVLIWKHMHNSWLGRNSFANRDSFCFELSLVPHEILFPKSATRDLDIARMELNRASRAGSTTTLELNLHRAKYEGKGQRV